MKRICIVLILLALFIAGIANAKVKIVASSSDLASIATFVGKELVDVTAIGQGRSNLHFVEVLPSYMYKVSKADIYLKNGLMLDQWAQSVIDGARNGKLVVVDCSKGITVLDKPTERVTALMGDIHPEGNPHYWLDPRNGKIIAENITDGLCTADPSNAATYRANRDAFDVQIDKKWDEWQMKAASFKGTEFISYHSTFVYFANAFGVTVAGYIEPKPGIEPTASHNSELIDLIKARHIKAILREPYYSARTPEAIARQTGATVYEAPSSVGGTPEARDYLALFDSLIAILEKAAG
ncbi:MAG: metal ABC transporter substrate-binding protein [Candidatus Zixiibacteriota bacterium]